MYDQSPPEQINKVRIEMLLAMRCALLDVHHILRKLELEDEGSFYSTEYWRMRALRVTHGRMQQDISALLASQQSGATMYARTVYARRYRIELSESENVNGWRLLEECSHDELADRLFEYTRAYTAEHLRVLVVGKPHG